MISLDDKGELIAIIELPVLSLSTGQHYDKRLGTIFARSEIRELRSEINELRNSIAKLEQRVVRLEGMMNLSIKLFIAFNVPILIGIIGILLKMIFSP